MPVESADDRAVFVNDFGVVASYTPIGGAAVDVPGVFDRSTIDVALDVPVVDRAPWFICRDDDLPDAAEDDAGDTLAIAGEGTFAVAELRPDGTGFTRIRLAAT